MSVAIPIPFQPDYITLLNTTLTFKPDSKLRNFFLTKRKLEKRYFTFAEALSAFQTIVHEEMLYDKSDPRIIRCSTSLAYAINRSFIGMSEIHYTLLLQMNLALDQTVLHNLHRGLKWIARQEGILYGSVTST